jgi:hypothetical protein
MRLVLVLSGLCPVSGLAADAASLSLHHADGREEALSGIEQLPPALATTAAKGDWRLVVTGHHQLLKSLHLRVPAGQRLIVEGDGSDAVLDFGGLPQNEAALSLDSGEIELRNLTMLNGPACCVQISGGVRYAIVGLRIIDARGGGIVVWGPCGVDEAWPAGNRIEQCLIERFNTSKMKWANDAISLSDNNAVIARNVIRDSPTETMGIRVMGAGNRIEGNLVQNVATNDAGGIYLWGGQAIYTAVGNIVRHNIVVGASHGIYLDDGTCAARVEQNYLIDCRAAALFIGGGRDNFLSENVALRCPVLAHVDNRRFGWPGLPEKGVLFAAARARLTTALRDENFRAAVIAGGLDVNAFETLPESAFNEPSENRIIANVMMPAGVEIQWQNFAQGDKPLRGTATNPALPNRLTHASDADWKHLSGQALGIAQMPAVADILQAH